MSNKDESILCQFSAENLNRLLNRYHEIKKVFPSIDATFKDWNYSLFNSDTIIYIATYDVLRYSYSEYCLYNVKDSITDIKFIRVLKKGDVIEEKIVPRYRQGYFRIVVDIIRNGKIEELKQKSLIGGIEKSYMDILIAILKDRKYALQIYNLRTIDLDEFVDSD